MADNTTLPGTGETYASDDIGGVKYFRSKLVWGADGAANDASAAAPVPATINTIIGGLAGGISGGISGAITLPTGAATEASVAAILAAMLADNAGFTDGTSKVLPSGYIYDEVAGTAVSENDVVAARVDIKRSQVFVQEDETTRGQRQTVYASKAAKVAASLESGVLLSAGAELTPKYKLANIAAAQTNSAIVAAVTSKKIRVVAAIAVCGGTATNFTFTSGSSGAISALFANGANGGFTLPFNPLGWFETVAGEALNATTGAGATTGVSVVYIEV